MGTTNQAKLSLIYIAVMCSLYATGEEKFMVHSYAGAVTCTHSHTNTHTHHALTQRYAFALSLCAYSLAALSRPSGKTLSQGVGRWARQYHVAPAVRVVTWEECDMQR